MCFRCVHTLFAKQNNIQLVGIGQFNKFCDLNFSDVLNSLEWATCYQYFDFCVTDRFHSTIFSLKNKVPFLVIESEKKYPTEHKGKIVDLLSKMDKLQYHQFYNDSIDFKELIANLIESYKADDFDTVILNLKSQFRTHLLNVIK